MRSVSFRAVPIHEAAIDGGEHVGVEHHSLEVSGGPGGEADRGRGLQARGEGGEVAWCGPFPGLGHERSVVDESFGLVVPLVPLLGSDEEHVTQIGARRADPLRHAPVAEFAVFVGYDEGACARECRCAADLVLAVDEGNEGGDGADGGQRNMEREERRPVRKLEDDHVPGTDAASRQAVGQTPDMRFEVGVAEPAEDRIEDKLPIRILPRDVGEPVGDEAHSMCAVHVMDASPARRRHQRDAPGASPASKPSIDSSSSRAPGGSGAIVCVVQVTDAGSIALRTGTTSLASVSRWARRRSGGITGASTK